jgi:hypothetical protein
MPVLLDLRGDQIDDAANPEPIFDVTGAAF